MRPTTPAAGQTDVGGVSRRQYRHGIRRYDHAQHVLARRVQTLDPTEIACNLIVDGLGFPSHPPRVYTPLHFDRTGVTELWELGYAASDIITTIFRVVKNFESANMTEWSRLEFIKEIGFTHVRILDGLDSFVQLTALVARLCRLGLKEKFDH